MNTAYIEFERCKECRYCVNWCPRKVLDIGEAINKSGYYTVVAVRPEDCIGCAICAKICPEAAITVVKG